MSKVSAPSELLSRIGTRVRRLRGGHGWTLRELAERSGLSQRFMSQLEGGQANIAVGRLHSVAEALGVSLAELVEEQRASEDQALVRIERLLRGREPEELQRCLHAVEATLGQQRRTLVALLGLRGAGKSTLGPKVAQSLGLPFVELDERIEQTAGLSLGEVFALHGEPYYRRLEGQCLASLVAEGRPCVVALPGGVVQNDEAFRLIKTHATTVWLKASPEDHMQRVVAQGDRRPMADREDAMAELRALLAAREPLYRQADLSLDTTREGKNSLKVLQQRLRQRGWSKR